MGVVYRVRDIKTGQEYIGKSTRYAARVKQHRKGRFADPRYVFEIIEECDDGTDLARRELHHIKNHANPLKLLNKAGCRAEKKLAYFLQVLCP